MMNASDLDLHRRCLEITTAKFCPVNCAPLCPNNDILLKKYPDKAKQNLLSYEDFDLVISKTPKDVMMVFAGFSEPFINKRAIDMMELAHSRGFTVTLSSTLVGLNPDDVERFRILDWISWHAPDNKGIAHVPGTQSVKDSIYNILTVPGVKIDEIVRMDSDSFFPEDRAGNAAFSDHKRRIRGPFYCNKLVRPQPVLLPNMDVHLCCEDWALRHRLGNMREQTYEEIVNGDVFKIIAGARHHMGGDHLCRTCSRALNPVKAVGVNIGWKSYRKMYQWARKSSGI